MEERTAPSGRNEGAFLMNQQQSKGDSVMENMMASFSSKEFGQIRVIQENGKGLF